MRILTVNAGSSSLRLGLHDGAAATPRLLLAAEAERIAAPGSRVALRDAAGATLAEKELPLPDAEAALAALLDLLRAAGALDALAAVGHRIVHGGPDFDGPRLLTPEVVAVLARLAPLAPRHQPRALRLVAATGAAFPGLPQVACFDTAFHRTMPPLARAEPLPAAATAGEIVRYGFHGLSCQSVLDQLAGLDPAAARGRLVVAHLGAGASLTAVRDGRSLETTMGFTPAGGIMMATRTGDLDPGVLVRLARRDGLDADALDHLVNDASGLLGVSGSSGDMATLLARRNADPAAAFAVDLFAYLAAKALGGLVAVLGGLDLLAFAGGIGEHAAPVRAAVCDRFGFLGLTLDPGRNAANAPLVSAAASAVAVRIVPSDEAAVIARQTRDLVAPEESRR